MLKRYIKLFLNELLECAVKFSDEGTDIIVNEKSEDGIHELNVTDYGTGMTQEESDMLCAFKQLNGNLNQQVGNGLGLVIVHNILMKYNGVYSINSKKVCL